MRFKSFFKQVLLAVLLLAGTVFLWVEYVPAARPLLARVGLSALVPDETAAAAAQGGGRRGAGASQVAVAEVTTGTLNDSVSAIGDGRAVRSVTVRSEVTGRITEISVEAGHRVEEGATIFRLDDAAEQIALDRARLVLADAEAEVARLERLRGSGAVSGVAASEAELRLRTAELGLRQAEFDLDQRRVLAPISGWIGLVEYDVGDQVTAQDTLAVLADRSEILIDFRVPERVLTRIETGMPLIAHPLALPGLTLEGRVSAIDNIVDRASRTMRVVGRLANEDDRLRDGMALSVTLTFPGDPFPAVDPLAVQWSGSGPFVWAVRDGKAVRVSVAIRQRNAESVLVEADLAPGEPVVIEGVQTLRPGADVTVPGDAAAMSRPADGGTTGDKS